MVCWAVSLMPAAARIWSMSGSGAGMYTTALIVSPVTPGVVAPDLAALVAKHSGAKTLGMASLPVFWSQPGPKVTLRPFSLASEKLIGRLPSSGPDPLPEEPEELPELVVLASPERATIMPAITTTARTSATGP